MGKDAVIDYLQMPERVKQIESTMERLVNNLDKLAEAIGGFGNLEDPKQLAEGQKKPGEYTV